MALLIDGYNLLHVTAIVGHGGLRGSREGLLRFLASAIDPRERPQTTIVFDAAEAPPNLPRTIVFEEMTIHFSSEYDNADELIEELIEAHNVPKSLLVVSSDHRLQRAARRRKAPFVDSDVWFAEALRRRAAMKAPAPIIAKPAGPLSGDEISYWLAEFGDVEEIEILPPPPRRRPVPKPRASGDAKRPPAQPAGETKPAKKKVAPKRKRPSRKPPHEKGNLANPFPPGYGEDLLEGGSKE
ncbi:NYN domain-containing protein [Lacipirellula sp.]|uniref:NYN domain-containing protein n=1 Tax=Lacipirellula sp. TaxID=2691419 RepID=UPI003D0D19D2